MATVSEMREWLVSNGYDEVPVRGRLRRELVDLYNDAHPEDTIPDEDDDPSVSEESGFASADDEPPIVTAETPPRRPRRPPRTAGTGSRLLDGFFQPRKQQNQGQGRGQSQRRKAKPKHPRVSLDKFLSRVYTTGGQFVSGFAPATGRCLQAQSAMAGVILEDIAKGTFADRLLQPVARAEDKLDKAFALVAPPVLTLALEMTAPDDMIRRGLIMTMLRESLLISMDVTAQYANKIEETARRSAVNEEAVDQLLAFILGGQPEEPAPTMAPAASVA